MVRVGFARGLLRRHVDRGADRGALDGERARIARVADRLGDAEVHDHRVPAGDEHVVGLDVAVHHAGRVRRHERLGDLDGEAKRVGDRQRALARHAVAERLARRHRHDVVQELAVARAPRVEEREDVRVVEPRRDADLPQEALTGERLRELRLEHLDGHVAVVLEVVREVHGGHAALAELALHAVAAVERGSQATRAVVRGRSKDPLLAVAHLAPPVCASFRLNASSQC